MAIQTYWDTQGFAKIMATIVYNLPKKILNFAYDCFPEDEEVLKIPT